MTRALRLISILLAAAALPLTAAAGAGAATAAPGKVNFVRNATSSFDPYLTGSSSAQKQWIAGTYWRIRGYDPFFADVGAAGWTGPSHYYEDIYAIYRDLPEYQQVMAQHPNWVLRDGSGKPLYIPADCNGSSCTQYAADIGNQDYRNWWISQAQATLAKGYEGIFIDDVNMDIKVADGTGTEVTPTDPRTGGPMSVSSWRRYMAEFTEQIDAALGGYEIVHNAHWWVSHDDPYVQRQVASADIIELERGYNDGGLVAGSGQWGYEAFMSHIDWLHSRGKSVILEPYELTDSKQEYELASYFLTKSGNDAIASDFRADPANFSDDWQTDLGAPSGPRYRWKGLWRRDYSDGIALVNQPEQPARTVELEPYTTLDGKQVTELTLKGSRGAVLLGDTQRKQTKISVSAKTERQVKLTGRVKRARTGTVKLRLRSGGKTLRTRRAKLGSKSRFAAKVGRLGSGRYCAEAVYSGSWETRSSSTTRCFRVSA